MVTPEIRAVVEDLLHTYVHCIDDDDLEDWPLLFASPCLYKIVPRENADLNLPIAIMYCDSQGMLQDRVTAHRKANFYGAHFYRHLVSSIRVLGRRTESSAHAPTTWCSARWPMPFTTARPRCTAPARITIRLSWKTVLPNFARRSSSLIRAKYPHC